MRWKVIKRDLAIVLSFLTTAGMLFLSIVLAQMTYEYFGVGIDWMICIWVFVFLSIFYVFANWFGDEK